MKKTLAILLSLMLLISALAGCGNNNNDNNTTDTDNDVSNNQTENAEQPREVAKVSYHEAAENFAGGSGTEADPFQISEAGHLVLLHEMLGKEEAETNFDDTYVKGYYILTADISLNDTSDFANWSTTAPEYGWGPIGAGLSLNSFAGVLDGNGHKISGIFMDVDGVQTESARDYYGLFAELKGTVKNLTIENSYMRASGGVTEVGTIAGHTYEAIIDNCNVDSVIELYSANNVGGVTGNGGTISNSSYKGTISQLDDSFVHIGGISGTNNDVISKCEFSGTLNGKGYTGGIVGYGANVKDSVNKGAVNGETAGGISGRVYAAGTDAEIKNPQYSIENNVNEGKVTATALAGGIIGWMGNDESDIAISVINCENKGQVICDEAVAGIIGKLSVERSGNIKIENCVNNTDISGKCKTSGIICDVTGAVLHQEGNVTVSGCKNTGNIVSEGQYSAGVVTYLTIIGDEVDFALTLDNCSNTGAVASTQYAGGILGFSNIGFNAEISAESMDFSDTTKIVFNKCNNAGNVTATNYNSMAGGIVGVLGLGYIPTEIKDCVNSGNVVIDFTLTDEQISGFQDAEWTEIYQIGGGVVGRIGSALKLTTSQEEAETSADNVNATEGKIVISGCKSTGTISAPDYSYILNKWGMPLFVNYLGGIVGQCSATDGYAFGVENCTYSGAERGLGDTKYPDIGTKN